MKNPKNILITGATGGIGKALAAEYAQKGILLFLTGRDKTKLQEISKLCRQKQAKVISTIIDVTDKAKMSKWIMGMGNKHGLDLTIACAGISAGTALGTESEKQISEIFTTNVDGVLNTVNPAVAFMQKHFVKTTNRSNNNRSSPVGQIAIMSSLAGFRGLPSSPSYSASKAAVRVYGEGLRGFLAKFNIEVNVICPGYIKTPMTDANKFPMPFLMESYEAAQIIKKSLAKNKPRIAFPFMLYFIIWLATLIPPKITDPIFAKLPGKK